MRTPKQIYKDLPPNMKLAGYNNPMQDLNEDNLIILLNSFSEGSYHLFLLIQDSRVAARDMPKLFKMMKEVKGTLKKIAE